MKGDADTTIRHMHSIVDMEGCQHYDPVLGSHVQPGPCTVDNRRAVFLKALCSCQVPSAPGGGEVKHRPETLRPA